MSTKLADLITVTPGNPLPVTMILQMNLMLIAYEQGKAWNDLTWAEQAGCILALPMPLLNIHELNDRVSAAEASIGAA